MKNFITGINDLGHRWDMVSDLPWLRTLTTANRHPMSYACNCIHQAEDDRSEFFQLVFEIKYKNISFLKALSKYNGVSRCGNKNLRFSNLSTILFP